MLPMKSELKNSFQRLLSDLEDATPNIKDTLLKISPVTFKINLKGHKDIYISIDKEERSISFDPKPNIDFEIISSLNELFRMLITKKVDRNIIKGDQELAMVLANTLQKADINMDMLSEGRDRAVDENFSSTCHFCQLSGEIIPFEDSTFYIITIGFGLRNFPDK